MKDKIDNIFLESECISEEVMYAYLENKLTQKEHHLVEIHLADCELCNDAVEGLSLIQDKKKIRNFVADINNKITALTNERKKSLRWIPNTTKLWSIAAAIAFLIIAGSVWIIFNNSNKDKEDKLVADKTEINKNKSGYKESIPNAKPDSEKAVSVKEESLEVIKKDNESFLKKSNAETIVKSPNKPIDLMEANQDASANDLEVADKLAVEQNVNTDLRNQQWTSQPAYKDQSTKSLNSNDIVNINNLTNSASPSVVGNADIQSLTYQSKDVSVKSEKKAKQKSNAFQAAKSIPHVNDSTREETSFSSQKSLSKNEVQMNAPMPAMSGNQDDKTNRKSAPQQFQLRKMDADKSPSMDSAMKKYNDKDYANAVALFNQILVNETSNYNAHYYAGLSYFSMDKSDSAILNFDFVLKIKNGEFYEASQWYKALALIKQNKLKSAKKLLNEIVTKGGSYKVQAQNKLEELDRK